MERPHLEIDDKDNLLLIMDSELYENNSDSEFDKTQYSEADIYYKFRYTFAEDVQGDLHCQKLQSKRIIKLLSRFMIGDRYTAGIEWFKSGMHDVKHHLHVHFMSRTKKDTIVKALKRADKDDDVKLYHGNRCYALCVDIIVQLDKFWRYPYKQQNGSSRKAWFVRGFTKDEVMIMRDVAFACWITASEIANKKMEKKEDTDQLSSRLYAHLDKMDTTTDIKIKIGIQQFYIEVEDRPFNRTTALGYFYNYKIMRNKMTHEELALTW